MHSLSALRASGRPSRQAGRCRQAPAPTTRGCRTRRRTHRFDGDDRLPLRWTHGAEAFGVYVTVRSGFTKNVTLDYAFGGPPGKAHYLCGPDAKQSPVSAGRVFSGSAK